MNDLSSPGEGPDTRVKVKICGLTRREDAYFAEEAGADFLGVVLVPGTPRCLAPEEAGKVLADVTRPIVAVMADLEVRGSHFRCPGGGMRSDPASRGRDARVRVAVREAGPWRVWKALRVREPGDVVAGLERFGDVATGSFWMPGTLTQRGDWSGLLLGRGGGGRDRFPSRIDLDRCGRIEFGKCGGRGSHAQTSRCGREFGGGRETGSQRPAKGRGFHSERSHGTEREESVESGAGRKWGGSGPTGAGTFRKP